MSRDRTGQEKTTGLDAGRDEPFYEVRPDAGCDPPCEQLNPYQYFR